MMYIYTPNNTKHRKINKQKQKQTKANEKQQTTQRFHGECLLIEYGRVDVRAYAYLSFTICARCCSKRRRAFGFIVSSLREALVS